MTEEKTWRQVNMEKATAARMRAAEEKIAGRLRDRGWTVLAPIDGPTDPQHYGDYCVTCDRTTGKSRTELICRPYALTRPASGGMVWHYRCPLGHSWTCWFSPVKGYFSDCMCDWCVDGRDKDGAKAWPRTPFYNDEQK